MRISTALINKIRVLDRKAYEPESVVGTASWTVRGLNPGERKKSRPALGPTQLPIQWVVQWEVDHSSPSSAIDKS